MSFHDYSKIERIRQQVTMSQRLAKKEPDFARYAGADLKTAETMAFIDFILDEQIFTDPLMVGLIQLYRSYLDYKRKAFFASIGSTELTKLGLLLGLENVSIRASRE